MTYGSDEDNEIPNRINNNDKSQKKNYTEVENLTKFIERPKNYFSDPVIDFSNLQKTSFLQIENLIINNVKQW